MRIYCAKSLSWSFISSQKCGFKIINNYFLHTFTQLTSIRNRGQQFCLVRARKRQRRNSGYPYRWQISTRPYLSRQDFSLYIVDLIHYKSIDFFFFKALQSPTKWVETPKGAFWHFPDFKRVKYSFSSNIPSMQCCVTVQATFRKQQTLQLWMEGTERGVDSFVLWSYPIWVCLNNFASDCSFKT